MTTKEDTEKDPVCGMCVKRPMMKIVRHDGTVTDYRGCVNCDNPKGRMPTAQDPT